MLLHGRSGSEMGDLFDSMQTFDHETVVFCQGGTIVDTDRLRAAGSVASGLPRTSDAFRTR